MSDRAEYFVHTKLSSAKARALGCTSTLQKGEIKWLSLHAFLRVFQRKQTRYTKLISCLTRELMSPKWSHLQVAHAIDTEHHTDIFEDILF